MEIPSSTHTPGCEDFYLTSPATAPEKCLILDGDSQGGRIITRGSSVSVSAFYLTSPATTPEKCLLFTKSRAWRLPWEEL